MPLRRLFAVLLLFASSSAFAQADPPLLQDLRWRLIEPFRGGRDAGRTWQPIFDSQPIGSMEDGADSAPSPDVVAGFDKAQVTLAGTLAAWEELKAKDLAVLNARLKQAGQSEIALAP